MLRTSFRLGALTNRSPNRLGSMLRIPSTAFPVLGKVMAVRDSQPDTKPLPMLSIPSGRVMEVMAVSLNARPPSTFRPEGRVTAPDRAAPLKALSPIRVREAGKFTLLSWEQPENA